MGFVGATQELVNFASMHNLSVHSSTADGHLLIAALNIANARTLTVPSGWTLLREESNNVQTMALLGRVWHTGDPTSYSFSWSGEGDLSGFMLTYDDAALPLVASGVIKNDSTNGSGSPVQAPSVTAGTDGLRTIYALGVRDEPSLGPPSNGVTERSSIENTDGHVMSALVGDRLTSSGAPSTEATYSGGTTSTPAEIGLTAVLSAPNTAPNASTQTNPVAGASIDRASTERFTWDFSDPDVGDSQSKFDLQIRPQGSTVLDVDATEETPNERYDLAGGTLTAGDYEWRVRTYDAQGEVGPWSGWEPFTAADTPDAPTITDPTSGQTISTEDYTVVWSASDQDAYQLRRVADNAGTPDTATVYFDTGTVQSSGARSRTVTFETNNRFEHVQVRVERGGLWSNWASVRVEVSYTPPAAPTATVVENDPTGAMSVLVDNGDWPVDVSTPVFTGTGTGDIVGPTATDGTTDSHDWQAECVATAADGGTFDVSVDGVVVGQAAVGAEFTYEGLSFTINDGPTDFALGDTFTWSTTAVKVSSNEVWRRRVADTGDGIRVAAEVPRGGSFVDWAVASAVGYSYRARAQGDNQTTSWGEWTETPSEMPHTIVDGGDAESTHEPAGTLDGGSA